MRWRRNSDEDISRLKRVWLLSGASSDYLPYRRACERAGLEPAGDGCSLCGGETWSSCSNCAAELCDDCYLECNECGEGVCLDVYGAGCAIECDNCKHLICPECAMCCKDCQHSHKLCSDENCNEDEEFIKRCNECDEYYCVQCSDDCYREHFADSCS